MRNLIDFNKKYISSMLVVLTVFFLDVRRVWSIEEVVYNIVMKFDSEMRRDEMYKELKKREFDMNKIERDLLEIKTLQGKYFVFEEATNLRTKIKNGFSEMVNRSAVLETEKGYNKTQERRFGVKFDFRLKKDGLVFLELQKMQSIPIEENNKNLIGQIGIVQGFGNNLELNINDALDVLAAAEDGYRSKNEEKINSIHLYEFIMEKTEEKLELYEVVVSFYNKETRDIFAKSYRELNLLSVIDLEPNKLMFKKQNGDLLDLGWANKLESIFTNEKYSSMVAAFEKKKQLSEEIPENLIDVFFQNRWRLLTKFPCDHNGGTWVSYNKENGPREFLNGKLNSSPNEKEINVSIVDEKTIKIQQVIFSNQMMTGMNDNKKFPVGKFEKVFTLISPKEYSYIHNYEMIDSQKFFENPKNKIYRKKTENGSAIKCK